MGDQQRPSFVRKWLSQDDEEIAEIHRVFGGYTILYHGIAEYFVSADGLESRVSTALSDSAEEVQRVHRNQIIPMAMSRQGTLVVHGSAVNLFGQCVAFVGVSGRGKSTLAAAFASQGAPFMTDDGLVVTVEDGVHSGVSRNAILSLRQESKAHFEQTSAIPIEILANGSKWEIAGEAQMPHCDEALPMSALYFLGEGVATDVRIDAINHHQAIQILLSNSFVLDTTDKAALTTHFGQISKLVAEVPCFALDYPRDFEFLPMVRAAIIKQQRQQANFCATGLPAGETTFVSAHF